MPEPTPFQTATLAQIHQQPLQQQQAATLGALLGAPRVHNPASPRCTWIKRWGRAERRALRLFRDMYGKKALMRYLIRGYVDYKAKDGRVYRVYREQHREVDVLQRTKQGMKSLYRLCLVDTESIPLTDSVMKRLWLAKADPAELHQQAHVKAANI